MTIEKTIAAWHDQIRGKHPGGLDDLLADDCVFHSPIVFSPQRGKELTKLYLNAAFSTFGGEQAFDHESSSDGASTDGFRYTKEVLTGNHAVLEFETQVQGTYINGVDIITCNDEGKIIEFKVMIRPLKAIQMMHKLMAAMLKKMQGEEPAG